jgi:hypothetical protein
LYLTKATAGFAGCQLWSWPHPRKPELTQHSFPKASHGPIDALVQDVPEGRVSVRIGSSCQAQKSITRVSISDIGKEL